MCGSSILQICKSLPVLNVVDGWRGLTVAKKTIKEALVVVYAGAGRLGGGVKEVAIGPGPLAVAVSDELAEVGEGGEVGLE